MISHKILPAGATTTFGTSAGGEQVRFKDLIVCGEDATNFVTLVVSGEHAYTAVFNAVAGCYCGPFEFDAKDKLEFTTEAGTVVLLGGFSLSQTR